MTWTFSLLLQESGFQMQSSGEETQSFSSKQRVECPRGPIGHPDVQEFLRQK